MDLGLTIKFSLDHDVNTVDVHHDPEVDTQSKHTAGQSENALPPENFVQHVPRSISTYFLFSSSEQLKYHQKRCTPMHPNKKLISIRAIYNCVKSYLEI